MPKPHLELGRILLNEGLITKDQLNKALDLQKRNPGQKLGMTLIKMKVVSEKDIAQTLSKQLDIPCVSLETGSLKPDKDQLTLNKLIPEAFARKNLVLPLFKHGDFLTVVMADPTNVLILDNLRLVTGCHIHRVIASASDIETSMGQFYAGSELLKSAIEDSYKTPAASTGRADAGEEDLALGNIVATAEKAPLIRFTDLLLSRAIRDRASDVHIEPFHDHISIRFRIDGVLSEIPEPDKSMLLPLISRIKILSKMDIAEKRLPQDGGFIAGIEGREVDFRVSTIPTVHGEKMVLRVLDKGTMKMTMGNMGLEKDELEKFRRAIHKPYGLILLTGPTGSGKTTTLYSAINELKGADKNITTIEDPVEYQIDGINQVAVKPSIGLTFAAGIRAFLRQDPDIMLVGEIRDLETAQICIRAAFTGRLVLSTLHTNDAPTAVNRLLDIGIEPFFVNSSLIMVVAQRLVRRLCDKCKEPYAPGSSQLPENFTMTAKTLYRPKGCASCAKTGYHGRLPIFEIMHMTEKIQEMISQHASAVVIRAEARKSGMRTLQESGFRKVNDGLTSVEEILRITMADRF